ncbi:MAG: protein arginine kinase [Chlamydiales bacterium]|nr:protein arginine kinase [Chlamydiales bacterium]
MTQNPELSAFLFEHTPWQDEVNPIWPISAFTLHRNLARHNFPPKLQPNQYAQVLTSLKNSLLSCKELDRPRLIGAEELSALDKELLFEHFLCFESFQNTTAGQAFLIDQSAKFLALINIGDHLQIQLLDSSGGWEKSWNILSKIEGAIAETLGVAYSPKFGYLTSDPNISGTGLIVQVFLHLPALTHTEQLQEALVKQKEEEVAAISLQGRIEEIVGDIIVLKNGFTLGISEENILRALHTAAMKFMALEKNERVRLKNEGSVAIKDQVSRAYGLLLHSYQLQTKETMDALSLLKLGLDLGWVTGISDTKLNDILFKCRHAHLSHLSQEKSSDPNQLSHRRAEFIHKELQGVSLKTEET